MNRFALALVALCIPLFAACSGSSDAGGSRSNGDGSGGASSGGSSASSGGSSSSGGNANTSDSGSAGSEGGSVALGKTCSGCPAPTVCTDCWQPAQDARWEYQLQPTSGDDATGGVDISISSAAYTGGAMVTPDVFDVDLYAADGTTPDALAMSALHSAGKHGICYVDAGTYENFRPDASDYTTFDASCSGCLLGKTNGWPGEQWLDVNNDKGQRDFILVELGKRLDKCVAAHFDGVEFDNVDGYSNTTGYTITAASQEFFNASIANLAHSKGLSVALKNDVEQATDLEPYFDYVVDEQCFEYSECDQLSAFGSGHKAIFNVEYNKTPAQFCANAVSGGINSIVKTLDLDNTPWTACK
jgi:hypothetical protein